MATVKQVKAHSTDFRGNRVIESDTMITREFPAGLMTVPQIIAKQEPQAFRYGLDSYFVWDRGTSEYVKNAKGSEVWTYAEALTYISAFDA